jgi:hypothetical protein
MDNQPGWTKINAKNVSVCKERPGILFHFETEADADEYLNNGLNSDRKEKLDMLTVYFRFDVKNEESGRPN